MNGITKRSVNLKAITSPTDLNIDGYTKDDILILSGGTVDAVRNGTNSDLKQLISVIIPDIPHNFGLVNSSRVHKETINYNRK
jgi:hypothetical protein